MKTKACKMGLLLGTLVPVVTAGQTDNKLLLFSNQHPLSSPKIYSRFLSAAEEPCKLIEACALCDAVARAEISECGKTGRVERWQCEPAGEGEG